MSTCCGWFLSLLPALGLLFGVSSGVSSVRHTVRWNFGLYGEEFLCVKNYFKTGDTTVRSQLRITLVRVRIETRKRTTHPVRSDR